MIGTGNIGIPDPFDAQTLFNRYIEMIDILESSKNKIYNDYYETVSFNVNIDTFIKTKYIAVPNTLRLFVNGVFYNNKCYFFNRLTKEIKWLFTDLNGGFDLEPSDIIELVYDINIDDNNLNNLTEIK